MKKPMAISSFSIFLCIQFISVFLSQVSAGEAPVEEYLLRNGLKVLVYEKHTAPIVAVQVWYRVGSHNEHPGIRGISHLFEHMMFRGSENVLDQEHNRLINDAGGNENAFTTEDNTVYHECLPANELELALRLEAERMHLLRLNEDILNTEREVVKEEYRVRIENNPLGDAALKVTKHLFPRGHPYSWTAIGVKEDLDLISVDDCRSYYKKYYAPNNAVLVVVGDVTADTVRQLTEKYFGSIPSSDLAVQPDLTLLSQKDMLRVEEEYGLPIPASVIAFHTPEARDPDIVRLQVLVNILSEGESSRLMKSVVRDKDLAMIAFGMLNVVQGPGSYWCAAAHFPTVSPKKLEKAMLGEIRKLKQGDFSGQELQKAKNQLLARKVFDRYSAESIANSIGYSEVILGDYRLYERDIDLIRNVTKDDIRQIANKYFTDANTTIIRFEPKEWNLLIWLYSNGIALADYLRSFIIL